MEKNRQIHIEHPSGDTYKPGEDYWPEPRPAVTEAAVSIQRIFKNKRLSRTEAQGAKVPLKEKE